MANEFKVKNGLIVDQGGAVITGSVSISENVTAVSFTGSLFGTASWSVNASTATTASYVNPLNQHVIITGSLSNGINTQAIGPNSHTEGDSTQAFGTSSHAEGSGTTTGGTNGYLESFGVVAGVVEKLIYGDITADFPAGDYLYVYENDSNSTYIEKINSSSYNGSWTTVFLDDISFNTTGNSVVGNINLGSITWTGDSAYAANYAHAEGYNSRALSSFSHAEGRNTQAAGRSSHAQGFSTIAMGQYSHAEGQGNQAIGYASHAEGENNQAIGQSSHAEGQATKAVGSHSHVEGAGAQAIGASSHAEGRDTITNGEASHAQGYATMTEGNYSHAEGDASQAIGYASHAEGNSALAIGIASHAEGTSTYTGGQNGYLATSVVSGLVTLSGSYGDVSADYPAGNYLYINDLDYDGSFPIASFIIDSATFNGTETEILLVDISVATTTAVVGNLNTGALNWAGDQTYRGDYSHAEGVSALAIGLYSHAEGEAVQAVGGASHAQGYNTIAIGAYSHAEGEATEAIGESSHAEGQTTIAIGGNSHAEGRGTQTIGAASHAEGLDTQAIGNYSHAEGLGTIASGSHQHVSGRYNTHGDDTSLFIIGNGVDDANRSDVFRVTGSIVQITGSLNVTGSQVSLFNDYFNLYVDGVSILQAGQTSGVEIASADGNASFDSNTRYLADSTSANSVLWNNRQLIKSDGATVTLDWENHYANDVNAILSIDWDKRQLNKSDSSIIVDWENGTFTGSLQGTSSWSENALTASYVNPLNQHVIITGSLTVSGSSTLRNIGPAEFTGSLNVTGSTTLNGTLNVDNKYYFINTLSDLPTPVGNIIALADNATYFFTTTVDLLGNRLVCGQNTTLLGGSSENSRIKSTGLTTEPLISSSYSIPMRGLTIEADIALSLIASGSTQAIDWFGVNFTNCPTVGIIKDYSNVIWTDCAFLEAANCVFDGTIGTVGFVTCLFNGLAGQTTMTLSTTGSITRRFRPIYSSFIALSGETALNIPEASIANTEGFILDTCNFSGGGTYLTGANTGSLKSLFVNNVGITNTTNVGHYYMINNTTATTIATANVFVKAAGTTAIGIGNSPKWVANGNGNNRINYSGSISQDFKFTAVGTVQSASANQVISVAVAKNGTAQAESEVTVRTGTANQPFPFAIQDLVAVATGDFIEVFIKNAATNAVTVGDLNVIIDKIGS